MPQDILDNGDNTQSTFISIPEMVKVSDFWVQKDILSMHWECNFQLCAGSCCSEGCSFTEDERPRIATQIQKIANYLRDRPELPFWRETPDQWTFYDPYPGYPEWYHSKVINNRCVFQLLDGRCAVHAYCLDVGIPWEKFKFNICTTWPLVFYHDFGTWRILLHHEFFHPDWDVCLCIRPEKLPPERLHDRPHMVEEMKSTIVAYIGQRRYEALREFIYSSQLLTPAATLRQYSYSI